MAYSKKRLIAAAMAGVLAMMSAFPGYAASRKKITSVSEIGRASCRERV